ncbi:MAG: hypothetical protein P8010_14075, partial [Desulfosarcinaceae bacterium]
FFGTQLILMVPAVIDKGLPGYPIEPGKTRHPADGDGEDHRTVDRFQIPDTFAHHSFFEVQFLVRGNGARRPDDGSEYEEGRRQYTS